jgi:RsiW-degrading membrane proteinase PrsW (M82 family)
MWNFILAFFAARAVRRSRPVRIVVLTILFGCFFAGLIYVYVVLQAVSERNNTPHVHAHSTH